MKSVADRLASAGIVAILRHLQPDRAVEIGRVLHEAGMTAAEVPLNDEAPALESIRLLAGAYGDEMLIGAGTVTNAAQVGRVHAAGGRFVVSPDVNPSVILASVDAGLVSCPGFMTPTEAFSAVRAGAHLLKLFPASLHGPSGLSALRAVLPPEVAVLAVGGATVSDTGSWHRAGATGLGIGSALFRPAYSDAEVGRRAAAFVAAWAEAASSEQLNGSAT